MILLLFIPTKIVWILACLLLAAIIALLANVTETNIKNERSSNTSRRQGQANSNVIILYLRGFSLDGVKKFDHPMPLGGGRKTIYNPNYEISLANNFFAIGRFITIARDISDPCDPDIIGAVRIVCHPNNWKTEVVHYLHTSKLVVLRPAFSDGLLWELGQIITNGYLNKTVICLSDKEDSIKSQKALKKTFLELLSIDVRMTHRFIYFDDKGFPQYVDNLMNIPLYKYLYLLRFEPSSLQQLAISTFKDFEKHQQIVKEQKHEKRKKILFPFILVSIAIYMICLVCFLEGMVVASAILLGSFILCQIYFALKI